MKIKTFKSFLSKETKNEINRISKLYRRAVREDNDEEEYSLREHMDGLIHNPVSQYSFYIFKDGVPQEDIGFYEVFQQDDIDIILRKWDEGWVPSVRTKYWDAPASTIDPECAVDSPVSAFAWGFGDAMTYHFLWKGA